MRLSIILATLSSLSAALAFPWPSALTNRNTKSYCPGRPASAKQQHDIFFDFINQLYVKKDVIGAFDTYIALNLVEHDPFDSQGRVANEQKLANIIPYVPSTVLRTSFDNNIGLAHVKVSEANKEPIALADIYRMDGTCIVEHWDVTQARPTNATNPIAMF